MIIFFCTNRFIILIFIAPYFTESVDFECTFVNSYWLALDWIYYCSVSNSVNITSLQDAYVISTTGTLPYRSTNCDIEGFSVKNKIVRYFPQGLQKFLPRIKGIESSGKASVA